MYAATVIITASTIAFLVLFCLSSTDSNSARYMLSSIVQCEAAVLSLVLSLSLIAVQLTASSYSPRAIIIFKSSKWLWGLLTLYIFSIGISLLFLKMIKETDSYYLYTLHGTIYIPLNLASFVSYFFGVACFIILIPYTISILNILRPSTIIDKLAETITKDNLLDGNLEKEDPIRPIAEIIRSSILKFDSETAEDGINIIGNKVSYLLENSNFSVEESKRLWKKQVITLIK